MKQLTLSTTNGFDKHSRATRKAAFLARMERLMPWAEFCALIEPHYPKAGNGRPPVGLERMLRMYCIANWFNLSDEACEDALYDVPVFREFCRIDLGQARAPDATTLLHFRHLLEANHLGAARFAKIGELLLANGMKLSVGTIGRYADRRTTLGQEQGQEMRPRNAPDQEKQRLALRHEVAHWHGQQDGADSQRERYRRQRP